MKCFYCDKGYSSRCVNSKLFGCPALDGGQAEYVRVPHADGTSMKAPGTISDKALILMADIFPTGFFGAKSGFAMLKDKERLDATAVVIGCGPVGLCAIIAALEYRPKHLFAIDSVDSRLELAKNLGAEPLNFMTDRAGMEKRIKEVTEGRGADVVIEVVGLSPALRTAYDVVRPFGVISSIGVHNAEVSSRYHTTHTVWRADRRRRYRGTEMRRIGKYSQPDSEPAYALMPSKARTCESRWGAAPCDPSSQRLSPCWRRSKTNLGRSRLCCVCPTSLAGQERHPSFAI